MASVFGSVIKLLQYVFTVKRGRPFAFGMLLWSVSLNLATELPVVIRHLLTQFAEPEHARHLLLEQRNSDDALTIKRATDPVIDLCGMVLFSPGRMGRSIMDRQIKRVVSFAQLF